MPALFVFLSVPLVLQGMSSHPTFCGTVFFCGILKHRHDLNEKCRPFSCPEKSICDEEVWYACLFHPCGSQEKTFITALLRADKVSLFIQSGRDKPWMRHCGTEREREREGEQRWTEGKDKEAAWYSIACVCPCEQMASIGEPSLLGQETGALTRCSDLLPVATSSRLSCLHVPPPCLH